MIQYKIDDVKEGMIVGKSLFDDQGKLLVAEGFCLEDKHIGLLRKKGYASIMVNVDGTEEVGAKSIISEQVKREFTATLNKSSEGLSSLMERSRETKSNINKIIKNDKKFIQEIITRSGALQVVNKVIDEILSEPWALVNLEHMKEANDSLYTHVVNVTIMSLCIGYKFHFSRAELRQLGLGAINYDIGMMAVPPEILNKEGELTEEERKILMNHTVYGHMMLTEIPSIPPTSSIVALSHHEHQDGTGFPQGLTGQNQLPMKSIKKGKTIHRFAEIVAIADTFEMLTYGRKHFAEALPPESVILKMIEMKRSKLNSEIMKTFISIVSVYPVGMRIRVVDSPMPELLGAYGVVAKVEPGRLFEPIVILIESKRKQRLPKPVMLDFSRHKGFSIELVG